VKAIMSTRMREMISAGVRFENNWRSWRDYIIG